MARPVENPPNPWHSTHVEYLEEPPRALLEVYEERARSILSENESPDLPYRYSLNPYRGCVHGCAYCYARQYHPYLDFGAGTDFERKVVVKTNAPELLEAAFQRPSWAGDAVMFSGATDCYQPLEASYGLTRRCLELCLAYGNPVAIVTKGALVQRDRALLVELHRRAQVFVFLSIPFDDDALGRAMEPWASSVSRRLEALRALSEAGVPCGVAFAPVIPGLNDHQLPAVLARAREAGASRAFMTLLRLTPEVRQVFEARLREAFPLRADKVLHGLVALRRGRTDERRFGARMRGEGDRWEVLRQLFELTRKRCGYDTGPYPEPPRSFRRPSAQGSLFDEAPHPRGTPTPRG